MKNSELLMRHERLLGALDKQRQHITAMFAHPLPCPNTGCAKPITVFSAMGIDIDAYDFDKDYDPARKYACPHCHYALRKVVPLFRINTPGHYWLIDEPLPTKEVPNQG